LITMPKRPEQIPGARGRRQEVLELLKSAKTPLSIAVIASQLGVHPNTVRFHLNTLVASGQAEHVAPAPSRRGRPAQLFHSVRRMDPAGPRHYELLAEILVHTIETQPEPSMRATDAGRAWGRLLAETAATSEHTARDRSGGPVARLVSLLGEMGFDPDLRGSADRKQIALQHCPFLELARSHAQVVCPIHLGLMQGAMSAWSATVTVNRLEPFAQPDLCVAHLAPDRAGL
jgi:predicted ArsR family transcriptional regulator